MKTVVFKNGNMIMNMNMCMCMYMYMCFVVLLSDRLSIKGKRRCTA